MIGQRHPPTTSKSQCHGPGFHGSPVAPRTRRLLRSCRFNQSSPWPISARIAVGEMPSTRDAVPLDQLPEPVGLGIIGRALVDHERRAEHQRCPDRPRPHHPAEVGDPEEHVARLHVEAVRHILRALDREAAVDVDARPSACPVVPEV